MFGGQDSMTTTLKTTARYSTILEVNRAAITEPSLNDIFRSTCGAMKKVIPYDRMAFSLFSHEHSALKLSGACGQGADSFYQTGLMLDEGSHHGWVFRHQKPIVRCDLASELEFAIEQPNVREGIRSYCAVPLIARGKSVGVFIVLSSQKNSYSETHADFIQEVSDQFVLALIALIPTCPQHTRTKLICPRCIASSGGQTTAGRYKAHLSDWGKQGGRGRKKPAGGFREDALD